MKYKTLVKAKLKDSCDWDREKDNCSKKLCVLLSFLINCMRLLMDSVAVSTL